MRLYARQTGFSLRFKSVMHYVPDAAFFAGKYRVASARRPGYDYRQTGAYFVTICTAARQPFFGEIVADPVPRLAPTSLAEHALDRWQAIAVHHPFATPGAFVVMPDHVHGLLLLHRAEDEYQAPAFGPQQHNLAAVVRGG